MKRLALLAAMALSCHAPPAPRPEARLAPSVAPAPSPAPEIAPEIAPDASTTPALVEPALAGERLQTWVVGDFEVAASLPVGARERRPVVVGIHGSHDRHDISCRRWRQTFAAWAFVVCPAGVPYHGGLAWGSPVVMAERIDRALAALRERYAAFIAEGPVVYAGWSLGATRGPGVVAARPGIFEPVILAEVGHTRLDVATSLASLRKGRASNAIIACATQRCAKFERRLETAKSRDPKGAKLGPGLGFADAGIGRGHVFDDRMARAIGAAMAKAVASDPRWNGFAAALEAPPEHLEPVDEPADDEDTEP